MKNLKFSEEIKNNCNESLRNYLELYEKGYLHLLGMTRALSIVWNPKGNDLRKIHNHYVDLLLSVYISKYCLLSESIIISVNRRDFITYALASRALIECTATLRYYIYERYKPLLDKRTINEDELQKLMVLPANEYLKE